MFDVDALESYLEKRLANQPELFGWLCARIADIPTIEAKPVVYGRLKHKFTRPHSIPSNCEVTCTACGYTKSRVDGEIIRYCQYCGAKLEGSND